MDLFSMDQFSMMDQISIESQFDETFEITEKKLIPPFYVLS